MKYTKRLATVPFYEIDNVSGLLSKDFYKKSFIFALSCDEILLEYANIDLFAAEIDEIIYIFTSASVDNENCTILTYYEKENKFRIEKKKNAGSDGIFIGTALKKIESLI